MNFDFKIILWSILLGVVVALIAFSLLTRKSRQRETEREPKSLLRLILFIVIVAEVGAVSYFSLLPQYSPGVVGFPSTGTNPAPEVFIRSVKSLYSNPRDRLITFSLLIAIFFLAVATSRNIKREKAVNKAKTEFVSLVSHQLRTPLTTISWYTEMILKGDVGKVVPSQKKYLEEIYNGDKRMIELVNTLLDVSRIEMGTFGTEPVETDMIALAESVLDEQKLRIEQKNLSITHEFDKNIPMIRADPRLLRMIFENLLVNAVAYTPIGGKIEFKILFDPKRNILVKMSDTGYGIPKNQEDKIFTKLFRADNIIDKDVDGTGLGLYIARSIVLKLRGKIWFESEENKGTTFYVTLPV